MRPKSTTQQDGKCPGGHAPARGGYAENMKNKCFCLMTPVEAWCSEEDEDD